MIRVGENLEPKSYSWLSSNLYFLPLWINVYSTYNFADSSRPLCKCARKSHLPFDEFSLWLAEFYTNEHLLMIQSTGV